MQWKNYFGDIMYFAQRNWTWQNFEMYFPDSLQRQREVFSSGNNALGDMSCII